MWMLLVLFYGVIKGIREVCKKKALASNSVLEVLFAYSIVSMIFLVPSIPYAGGLLPVQYLAIALKAFVLFVGWMLSFKSIKHLPISMYGVLDLSRVLFATILGITILGESPTLNKTLGLALVCGGLLLLKFNPKAPATDGATLLSSSRSTLGNTKSEMALIKGSSAWYVLLAFIGCIMNAISGVLDKILMKDMTSTQLQFWYMLFLAIYYSIYVVITRTKISTTVWKNGWVWLLAILLLIMDKALFIANADPASQVTIMTLIKQSGVIVTILAGKLVFKEKNILHKLICAGVIIAGIILGIC